MWKALPLAYFSVALHIHLDDICIEVYRLTLTLSQMYSRH